MAAPKAARVPPAITISQVCSGCASKQLIKRKKARILKPPIIIRKYPIIKKYKTKAQNN